MSSARQQPKAALPRSPELAELHVLVATCAGGHLRHHGLQHASQGSQQKATPSDPGQPFWHKKTQSQMSLARYKKTHIPKTESSRKISRFLAHQTSASKQLICVPNLGGCLVWIGGVGDVGQLLPEEEIRAQPLQPDRERACLPLMSKGDISLLSPPCTQPLSMPPALPSPPVPPATPGHLQCKERQERAAGAKESHRRHSCLLSLKPLQNHFSPLLPPSSSSSP